MLMTNQAAIYAKALSLMADKIYIITLIAEIYDAEHNDRPITPEDVARIKHTITIEYLKKIATDIITGETSKAVPHGCCGTYDNP